MASKYSTCTTLYAVFHRLVIAVFVPLTGGQADLTRALAAQPREKSTPKQAAEGDPRQRARRRQRGGGEGEEAAHRCRWHPPR